MKSFLRSQLFPQELRRVLSTMGEAEDSKSTGSALEEYNAPGGSSDLLSQHDGRRATWAD